MTTTSAARSFLRHASFDIVFLRANVRELSLLDRKRPPTDDVCLRRLYQCQKTSWRKRHNHISKEGETRDGYSPYQEAIFYIKPLALESILMEYRRHNFSAFKNVSGLRRFSSPLGSSRIFEAYSIMKQLEAPPKCEGKRLVIPLHLLREDHASARQQQLSSSSSLLLACP